MMVIPMGLVEVIVSGSAQHVVRSTSDVVRGAQCVGSSQ